MRAIDDEIAVTDPVIRTRAGVAWATSAWWLVESLLALWFVLATDIRGLGPLALAALMMLTGFVISMLPVVIGVTSTKVTDSPQWRMPAMRPLIITTLLWLILGAVFLPLKFDPEGVNTQLMRLFIALMGWTMGGWRFAYALQRWRAIAATRARRD